MRMSMDVYGMHECVQLQQILGSWNVCNMRTNMAVHGMKECAYMQPDAGCWSVYAMRTNMAVRGPHRHVWLRHGMVHWTVFDTHMNMVVRGMKICYGQRSYSMDDTSVCAMHTNKGVFCQASSVLQPQSTGF